MSTGTPGSLPPVRNRGAPAHPAPPRLRRPPAPGRRLAPRRPCRALREARLAAQLRGHPHVVAVYDVLVDDGDIWLVMEYLPARSLREILRAHGPLDCGEVARIGTHVADALAAAHDRGIEHRDVKMRP